MSQRVVIHVVVVCVAIASIHLKEKLVKFDSMMITRDNALVLIDLLEDNATDIDYKLIHKIENNFFLNFKNRIKKKKPFLNLELKYFKQKYFEMRFSFILFILLVFLSYIISVSRIRNFKILFFHLFNLKGS